jgi:hypothetical protein
MLIFAMRVIAGTTYGLKPAERLHGVYLMTVSWGEETTRYFLRVKRMIAIALKHAERTLVRDESSAVHFVIRFTSLSPY